MQIIYISLVMFPDLKRRIKMVNVLIITQFENNIINLEDPRLVSFVMQGNSAEKVTKTILNVKGKHAINLDNGYKIINFGNACRTDIQLYNQLGRGGII